MDYSVYKHTFPNGKVYIGITSLKPEKRWNNGWGYKSGSQSLMHKAIDKYGWDNVDHEILFNGLTKEEAEQKEIELINKYKSNNSNFGYNIDNGGNSVGKLSEKTKKKMSEVHKRINLSEETRKKLSEANKGEKNAMYGKHHTEEAKKRISKLKTGVKLSEEHKKKIAIASKGRWHSEEARAKISKGNKGKIVSEETRIKISESLKGEKSPLYGKHHSEETKIKMGVPVRCIETNIVYYSATYAEKETGINATSINQVCNCKRRTAGGYHWEYIDEDKKKFAEEHKSYAEKPNNKPVRCIETNTIYKGRNEASRQTGIHKASIGRCCNGKQMAAGGYHWEYIEKEN